MLVHVSVNCLYIQSTSHNSLLNNECFLHGESGPTTRDKRNKAWHLRQIDALKYLLQLQVLFPESLQIRHGSGQLLHGLCVDRRSDMSGEHRQDGKQQDCEPHEHQYHQHPVPSQRANVPQHEVHVVWGGGRVFIYPVFVRGWAFVRLCGDILREKWARHYRGPRLYRPFECLAT